jgi:hypothetical protein
MRLAELVAVGVTVTLLSISTAVWKYALAAGLTRTKSVLLLIVAASALTAAVALVVLLASGVTVTPDWGSYGDEDGTESVVGETMTVSVEGVVTLNYQIPEDLHRQLKVLAAQQGMTLKALAETALREYIERHTPSSGRRPSR